MLGGLIFFDVLYVSANTPPFQPTPVRKNRLKIAGSMPDQSNATSMQHGAKRTSKPDQMISEYYLKAISTTHQTLAHHKSHQEHSRTIPGCFQNHVSTMPNPTPEPQAWIPQEPSGLELRSRRVLYLEQRFPKMGSCKPARQTTESVRINYQLRYSNYYPTTNTLARRLPRGSA